ncbi:hypothetical protein [Aromatoleum evansii]|uniref:hypothetical protein n=1 Tax=Aromatoleum evansii TaxID=59406 RepID=UPI00145C5E7B|nr:hypothetical protein [Aromatoleum evansii]NMG31101.1 hypothetical protein [Aromatoleum evansii]
MKPGQNDRSHRLHIDGEESIDDRLSKRSRWNSEERRAREAWLRVQLDPSATGSGAGGLAGESSRVIARHLGEQFGREISERSARRYVQEAQVGYTNELRVHRGGRPKKAVESGADPGAAKRGRGRPRKAVDTSHAKGSKLEKDCTSRHVRGGGTTNEHSQDLTELFDPLSERELFLGVCADLMHLCGVSASHLHRLLKQLERHFPTLHALAGCRSGFLRDLSAAHGRPRRVFFPIGPGRKLLNGAISLRQIVLFSPRGFRVVALACELRTLFINAHIFEVSVPEQLRALAPRLFPPRRGNPAEGVDRGKVRLLECDAETGELTGLRVALPTGAIEALVHDTCDRVGFPVTDVMLGPDMNVGANAETAWRRYLRSDVPLQQNTWPLLGDDMPTDAFRRQLAGLLNEHNRWNALDEVKWRRSASTALKHAADRNNRQGRGGRKRGSATAASSGQTILEIEKAHPVDPRGGTRVRCAVFWAEGLATRDDTSNVGAQRVEQIDNRYEGDSDECPNESSLRRDGDETGLVGKCDSRTR